MGTFAGIPDLAVLRRMTRDAERDYVRRSVTVAARSPTAFEFSPLPTTGVSPVTGKAGSDSRSDLRGRPERAHGPHTMAAVPGDRFQTTRWSLVRAAAGDESPAAREALAALCEAYWYPLYAYVRRQGQAPEDAQDATQAFFARLLERHDFAGALAERGRFRSYLLASLKHFLINQRRDRHAAKRGGGRIVRSLDAEQAEGRYVREPADMRTPEALFERRWALTVLERAMERLRARWQEHGKRDRFDRLQPCLLGADPACGYAALGRDLDMTEGAVKVAVHRLRREYREALTQEIADTVEDESLVADEVRALMRIVGR